MSFRRLMLCRCLAAGYLTGIKSVGQQRYCSSRCRGAEKHHQQGELRSVDESVAQDASCITSQRSPLS